MTHFFRKTLHPAKKIFRQVAEQDSIRPQAKAAAMADAKRDLEVLTSFRADMRATFAAGMCGLMTGFVADATLGQGQDALFTLACF